MTEIGDSHSPVVNGNEQIMELTTAHTSDRQNHWQPADVKSATTIRHNTHVRLDRGRLEPGVDAGQGDVVSSVVLDARELIQRVGPINSRNLFAQTNTPPPASRHR